MTTTMPLHDHIDTPRLGAKARNRWRRGNPGVRPILADEIEA